MQVYPAEDGSVQMGGANFWQVFLELPLISLGHRTSLGVSSLPARAAVPSTIAVLSCRNNFYIECIVRKSLESVASPGNKVL